MTTLVEKLQYVRDAVADPDRVVENPWNVEGVEEGVRRCLGGWVMVVENGKYYSDAVDSEAGQAILNAATVEDWAAEEGFSNATFTGILKSGNAVAVIDRALVEANA